jgi:hypothetical protein
LEEEELLTPIVRAAKCFSFCLTYNQSMHDDCSLVVGTLKHEICFFREEMEFLKREREREREREIKKVKE